VTAATDTPKTQARSWWLLAVLLALLLPLVGHGCHGDEVDHEPTAVSPPPHLPR
jgi:hypothetical protein